MALLQISEPGESTAPHQPRAHRHRLGDAARDRGAVDFVDQILRRYLRLDVGRILDDHVRHGFLRSGALTRVANFLMFWASQASASSDAYPGRQQ